MNSKLSRPSPAPPTRYQPPRDVGEPHLTLNLGRVIMALRRRRWLIAVCIVTSMVAAAAYTKFSTPVFQATSIVRFESEQVNLPQLVQILSTENRIGTEVDILKRRTAAEAVVDSLGLRADLTSPRHAATSSMFSVLRVAPDADLYRLVIRPGAHGEAVAFGPGGDTTRIAFHSDDTVRIGGVTFLLTSAARGVPELAVRVASTSAAVRAFESGLDVSRPSREADLVAIKYEGRDPVRVSAVANLLAEQLISRRRQLQIGRSENNIRFLQDQLDTLGKQLRIAEDTLRAYRESAGAVDAQEAARTQVGRLAQIQADRGALVAERDALAKLLDQVRSDSAKALPGDPTLSRTLMSFPTLLRNQAAGQLFGALTTVENERAELLVRRTPQDPDVQVLSDRIRELDGQLEGIAETYLQGLTDQVDALNNVARGFGTALDSLPGKEVEAARRERAVKVDQDLYSLIQTRLKEAQITGGMDDPSVHIVDRAVVPDGPVRPRPLINLTLALVLGTMVGVTVSIGREVTDRIVRTRADALLGTGVPVLGAVPRVERRLPQLPGRRRSHGSGPSQLVLGRTETSSQAASDAGTGRAAARLRPLMVTRAEAPPAYVESLNQLYANLMLTYRETPLQVVAVTSPLPGEGKTLTSINLALTVASRGRRVLLVDADLRRGLINTVFAAHRRPGLSELLNDVARAEDCLRVVPVGETGTMTILPTGALLNTPGPLLRIDRVRQVLGALAPQFDLVIVDTPPVNLLADAALLGAAADAVLVVVRTGHTSIDTLQYAMDQLSSARAPVVGTVLNDVDLRRHRDDDASYRYLVEAEQYYQGRS